MKGIRIESKQERCSLHFRKHNTCKDESCDCCIDFFSKVDFVNITMIMILSNKTAFLFIQNGIIDT